MLGRDLRGRPATQPLGESGYRLVSACNPLWMGNLRLNAARGLVKSRARPRTSLFLPR